MNRTVTGTLAAVGLVAASASALSAQARATQPASPRIQACALLPTAEVKRYLPWIAALDRMPPEEEAIGVAGSSCNYPSVFIQVLPFTPRTLDVARQKPGVEKLAGLGDEAYFFDNAGRYAELYVKAGTRLLTVQANVNTTVAAVKPGAVSLARALVAKLR